MIFNKTEKEWEELKGYWTAKEIRQQPETWSKTLVQVKNEQKEIESFIKKVTDHDDYDIILTGAGTSEFVGNAIYSYIGKISGYKCKSYATTDIVAAPENYLDKTRPTLIISYGRSGNSPESMGTVHTVNAYCENAYHLLITCNPEGAMAKYAEENTETCYAINLTPETHDQSFAMTSSFSNMYLANVLSFSFDEYEEISKNVQEVISKTDNFLSERYEEVIKIVEEYDFKKIVYLGSNTLKGVAQESALKMCELNKGQIVTVYDSPMGFRHGPKSVIDPTALTVLFMSDNEYTRQYEYDLLKEMASQRDGNKILCVSSTSDDVCNEYADYNIVFNNEFKLDNVFLGLEYITVAQLIGLYKSANRGITPDNPCPTGEVNRVVKGVTIYPYKK